MKNTKQKSNAFWDFWFPALLTIFLYSGIRQYIAEARYIPSGSMLPGLQINDRLLIEKLTYRTRKAKRGEIVVFKSPYSFDPFLQSKEKQSPFKCAMLNFPLIAILTGISDPACDAYIKRVVAIPGDRVSIDSKGQVFINKNLLHEPYVQNFCQLGPNGNSACKTLNKKVPLGHVLVLGDNRSNSWDSRFWPGGAFLPDKAILGRAVWRFWPINRLGSLGSGVHN